MSLSQPDSRPQIKLAFSDFGTNVSLERSSFLMLVAENFNIKFCDFDEADFLIYNCFGFRHAQFKKGIKIFFTEENRLPDWTACDYAFTHELLETERHMRVPCYVSRALHDPHVMKGLMERPLITHDDLRDNPRKFCSFVFRNGACKTRNRFFKKLSQYKKIDSGGVLFNNIGYRVEAKAAFQRQYKFSIAFENEAHPGYQTEKLPDALRARTLPVYWGNIEASKEFDSRSFLDYSAFRNEDELIEKIIEIDRNDDLLLEYLNAPILLERSRQALSAERLIGRLEHIFSQGRVQRTEFDHFKYIFNQVAGRGLPKQLNRFSRYLRGKK